MLNTLVIHHATVLRRRYHVDKIWLDTDLISPISPSETVSLEFEAPRGEAEKFLELHWPNLKLNIINVNE
jgi:hypothetical protein